MRGEKPWHTTQTAEDCSIFKQNSETGTNSSPAMPLCIFTQNKSGGGIITLSEAQPRGVISGPKRCFLNNEITSQ